MQAQMHSNIFKKELVCSGCPFHMQLVVTNGHIQMFDGCSLASLARWINRTHWEESKTGGTFELMMEAVTTLLSS
jgi:hypothetical protein